ncbi:MAG: gamma carbonic anhydrase family protein [Methylococcales bacterium]|nr:gamma carbonic anhydrase family protein [Methylococcales bacterium]MBT7445064.1 gamma carbonic anhydrase family protein [Methylococcales bacterium]
MTIRAFEDTHPKIADSAFIDGDAHVSGNVSIGEHASIWPMAVLRGDVHAIRVGDYTNIQDGSILHVTHASPFQPEGSPLTIGNHVTVGHKVILHGCTIADYCLIGMGSIVLDNAIVEPNTIVGAGSLVPSGKVLTGGHLWLGTPARKIRELTDKEIEFFQYSSNHYKKLKDRTLASL